MTFFPISNKKRKRKKSKVCHIYKRDLIIINAQNVNDSTLSMRFTNEYTKEKFYMNTNCFNKEKKKDSNKIPIITREDSGYYNST